MEFTMFKKILVALSLAFTGLIGGAVNAEEPIYTGLFNDRAVSGYDTVEYFKSGTPTKGKKAFKLEHMGAEWRFASQENLEAFKADPQKYMPQYGGYCAWAMARGYTASGDPKQWKIVDGKLYLNYDAKVKATWEENIPHFISEADKRYPTIVELEE